SVTSTGGIGSLTYTLAQGSNPLPAGLNLAASGVITGTPTVPGSYTFTVLATDSSQPTPQSVTGDFTIHITNSLAINTPVLNDAVMGSPYTAQLTATGGTGQLTWALATGADPLPNGLTLSGAGAITGTATVSGTFALIIQV